MRNVEAHLLGDKMEEAVTHYINTHQPGEHVQLDTDGLPMTVQDDGSRITVMQQQTYSTHMCRQLSVTEPVGEGPWSEEILDPEGRIAAIVAHLAQNSRSSHHHPQPHPHHKVPARNEVDSVILDSSIRFNGQSLEQQSVSLAGLPSMQTLPPLQEMKRCETDWFNDKNKKNESQIGQLTDSDGPVLEIASGSPAHSRQQNRKSLPHKKRISRKLKRNGSSTPQQDLVVINSIEPVVPPAVEEEQILPDNYVTVQQQTHHMSHEMRPILICQICGDFYGEEQLKFFHHLKQHYEPHNIIIDNPVSDLVMDKMTNTCIVDNVATLPDSIVELSLENSVPKTMYQPIDKHTNIVPLNYNNIKVPYSMANMEKEPAPESEKTDLYETLNKLDLYNCGKCNKTFRKQKQCEAHMREAHPSHAKLEDMGEFSEPEDLMAGIHVCVSEYEQPLLPHLTVDNGHVHQDHTRHWYSRNGTPEACQGCAECADCPDTYTRTQTHDTHDTQDTHVTHVTHTAHATHVPHVSHSSHVPHVSHSSHVPHVSHSSHVPHVSHSSHVPHVSHSSHVPHVPHVSHVPQVSHTSHVSEEQHASHSQHVTETHDHVTHSQDTQQETQPLKILKEEVLQRIFDNEEVPTSIAYNIQEDEPSLELEHKQTTPKKNKPELTNVKTNNGKRKRLECSECGRVFVHRNSLMYHMLSHAARQHSCTSCPKTFFTSSALKIHKRVHNGDKPYKCNRCGRDFRQWSDLKYHTISLHSDEKPFKCEFCNKDFSRKYSLNVHRRIHTGEKNYKCDYCSKTFSASSYRLTHMRTHTGDRPYKCDQCDKCFRSAFDVRRHLLVHDKIRNRFDGIKPKPKEKKTKQGKEKKVEVQEEPKIEPTSPSPTLLKKSPKKKSPLNKKGAPNITVLNKEGPFKINEYQNTEEFERPQLTKFKSVYVDSEFKESATFKHQPYKDSDGDRDGYAVLRPLLRLEDRQYRENTDGKLQIFTHVERKEYIGSIVPNSQGMADIRHLDREVRDDRTANINGEVTENGFLERLTALYNVPA